MPLYEYECTACHKRTEKIQKFSDPEITTCPKCGGALERVLSAPAIAFKGGGWFADGYGNAKPASGSGAGSSDSGSSDGGGNSDSKPASAKPATDSSSTGTASSSPAPAAPAAAAASSSATSSGTGKS